MGSHFIEAMEVEGKKAVTAGEGRKEKGVGEGRFMLGSPTFEELGNGRLRCVETGHELPAKDAESYRWSRGCRLAFIDSSLSNKRPPLNMFKRDPLSKSKLICKLTGDTINKSEEHIWKHINGKRFLNRLQLKEVEKLESARSEKDCKRSSTKLNSALASTKKKKKKGSVKDDSITQEPVANGSHKAGPDTPVVNGSDSAGHDKPVADGSDSDEHDFWTPPVGSRWDFDNGKDRWESCTISGLEINDDAQRDGADEEDGTVLGNPSVRTKRMAIDVRPSSFASKKKKIKKTPSHSNGD